MSPSTSYGVNGNAKKLSFSYILVLVAYVIKVSGDAPPRFTSLPATQVYFHAYMENDNGVLKEPIELHCTVNGGSGFQFKWKKDGKNITPADSHYNVATGTHNTTLHIKSLADNVTGSYQCMAQNKRGKILAGPTKLIKAGSLSKPHPHDVVRNVPLGGTVEEACPHLSSTTPVEIKWYKMKGKIQKKQISSSWRKLFTNTGRFMISQVREEDVGTYYCEAEHRTREQFRIHTMTLNKSEGYKQVNLLSIMYHSPRHTYVKSGEDAVISVLFAYNRNEKLSDLGIKWYKDGVELSKYQNRAQIKFPANKRQNGKYTATATTPDKDTLSYTVELHVTERPRIDKGPENYNLEYSKTVTAFCNATGFPIPDVTIRIKPHNKSETNKGSVSLVFDPEEVLTAHVSCNATNEDGWEEASGTITIVKNSDGIEESNRTENETLDTVNGTRRSSLKSGVAYVGSWPIVRTFTLFSASLIAIIVPI